VFVIPGLKARGGSTRDAGTRDQRPSLHRLRVLERIVHSLTELGGAAFG
jgi:hypothetical protein